ncbi:hypothetical protein GCM10010121_009590 [Streptomyces brasiliensis]|uniref:Uncharacterized protein n=1 Tax=Streptomyces brasiliensis TaxID=1954 RepID=A0A917K5Z5_9ACTN|nr:hypothetical protein GCM10010121_009590 [Streptomyces brasiliensis]
MARLSSSSGSNAGSVTGSTDSSSPAEAEAWAGTETVGDGDDRGAVADMRPGSECARAFMYTAPAAVTPTTVTAAITAWTSVRLGTEGFMPAMLE